MLFAFVLLAPPVVKELLRVRPFWCGVVFDRSLDWRDMKTTEDAGLEVGVSNALLPTERSVDRMVEIESRKGWLSCMRISVRT